ncbi:unnamed protein product [Durusdinium trenchii]|uniref:Uncharacterized protein n=2 Tax=Durusdinium trenchii TaxID=1381693 RepID=A0ABP0MBX7_9DINO
MEDGLLRTFHLGLSDANVARRRQVAQAARTEDRGSLGYGDRGVVEVPWSQMEALLEADVALLRSQLDALPIWDPELHTRLRRWASADGARDLEAGERYRFEVAPEGGALECSGTVSGESLALLTGEAPSRSSTSAWVWVYRFTSAATAAAQLCHHPTLAATASQLRAAVVCRTPEMDAVVGMQVYLAAAWRATSSTPAPPTNTPLPLAAAARGEKRLRQLALEVMVAEALDFSSLAALLRAELASLAQALRNGSTAAPAGPRFACRLADLACLDEDGKEDSTPSIPLSSHRSERPSRRRSRPEMSEKALLESDVTAALAAAKRLLKRDLSEVLNPPPPPPPNANQLGQLEVQQGLLHLARGIDAKAFVHSGDQVPIRLAVLPDYSMSVEVSGDVRLFRLTEVDQVASGEKALELLEGVSLRCKPPWRICALKMKDGTCLALLPSEVVPDVFVRCLQQLQEGAEESEAAKPGPVKRPSSARPSGGQMASAPTPPAPLVVQEPWVAEPVAFRARPVEGRDGFIPRTRLAASSSPARTASVPVRASASSSGFLSASVDAGAPLPQTVCATPRQAVAGTWYQMSPRQTSWPTQPVTPRIWRPVVTLPAHPSPTASAVGSAPAPVTQPALMTQAPMYTVPAVVTQPAWGHAPHAHVVHPQPVTWVQR